MTDFVSSLSREVSNCFHPFGETIKGKDWVFRVSCDTDVGETVCVVGDCPELGSWKHDESLVLSRESSDSSEWSSKIRLQINTDIKYRYFVCVILENNDKEVRQKSFVVRRWETNIEPRLIRLSQRDSTEIQTETFGYFNSETEHIDNGWLTAETVIQFKISNAIQLWKKSKKSSKIRLKMIPIDLVQTHTNTSSDFLDSNSVEHQSSSSKDTNLSQRTWPIIEVAVITENEFKFKLQTQFGHIYEDSEMLVFQAQVLDFSTVAYMIDIYEDSIDIPSHLGSSHILPSNLRTSCGSMIVPITSTHKGHHRPIGQLSIDYVVVFPMRDSSICDMSVSFTKYWKNSWTGLDVGHRGMGNSSSSFKSCANMRENTIASLQRAADHGADFVEFDVQLSKDLVPVLFHDFHANIRLNQKPKQGGGITKITVPVKELTLSQLHELSGILLENLRDNDSVLCPKESNFSEPSKVYHVEEPHTGEKIVDDLEEPFPTLQHALEIIDYHVGFNVELKWTMQLNDGSWELENPFELNLFVDIVLETVLKFSGSRRIVFSCFHPDICLMIRYKQNKYPVLFLTQGVTQKWPAYNDPRTRSIPIAIYYALSSGILGLSIHTEDILRDPSQIKVVLSHGLVAFCWGEDNNDSGTIKYLKELGLNGVIYDRIDDHLPKHDKKSIFYLESQQELIKIANSSNPNSSIASSSHTQLSNGNLLNLIPFKNDENERKPA